MIKIILTILILSHLSYGKTKTITLSGKKLESVIEGLGKALDGKYFYRHISFDLSEIEWCKPSDALIKVPGPRGSLMDITTIGEVTREHMRLEFMQLDLGDKFDFSKTGKINENEGAAYTHIIHFPILGMILKKSTKGWLCLASGSISVIQMSEFDPTSWNSILRLKLIPVLKLFLNQDAAMYGIASCAASVALEKLSASYQDGDAGKGIRAIIDSLWYNNGCGGMKPVGAHANTENPISSAMNIILSDLSLLSMDTPLVAQTVTSILNNYDEEIYCKPKYGPHIMANSQFRCQLLRPRQGDVFVCGTTPAEWATFKNDGTTGGNSVFFLWELRMFTLGAYSCGK